MSRLTVACVLRSGGVYDASHVERLRDQVAGNLGPHRFVCLADCEVPCERIPLETDWPGWWAKLELFKHDLGPVAFLDLDVTVQGPIEWLRDAAACTPLAMMRNFRFPKHLASAVMAWTGPRPQIAEGFDRSLVPQWRQRPDRWGDQGWIEHRVPHAIRMQDRFPGEIASFRRPREASAASIVVWFGPVKPWSAVGGNAHA